MGVIVRDTMTDVAGTNIGSHVGEVGATWDATVNDGNTAVITAAGRVRASNAGFSLITPVASGVPESADYDVEADLVIRSLRSNQFTGVIGRFKPLPTVSQNHYRVIYDNNNQQFIFQKNDGSGSTTIATVPATLTIDQAYRVVLRMKGTSIKFLLDGSIAAETTDSSVTDANNVGLYLYDDLDTGTGDAVGAHLDNVLARSRTRFNLARP